MNLEKVINGCVKNNREDQRVFYTYYAPYLLAVGYRMAPDDDIAKDLVQISFLKIFDKIYMLDNHNPAVVMEWCKKIVRHTIIDYIRVNKNALKIFSFDDVHGKINMSVKDDVYDEEDNYLEGKDIEPSQIMGAIKKLSLGYKLVFNLYVLEGYTHQEISEILEISVGASKSNLSKAKAKLRKELEVK